MLFYRIFSPIKQTTLLGKNVKFAWKQDDSLLMSEVTMHGLVEDQKGDLNFVSCWRKSSVSSATTLCKHSWHRKKKKAKCLVEEKKKEKKKKSQSNPRRKQINVSEEPNQVKIPPLFRLWWFKSQIFCLLHHRAQEFKCGPARFSGARYAALIPLPVPLPSSVGLFSSPPTRFIGFSFVADFVKGCSAFEGHRRLWSISVWNYEIAFFSPIFSFSWKNSTI